MDRSFKSQNVFDSSFRLTMPCHGNSLPPYASGSSLQSLKEFDESFGVVVPVRATRQSGFIAGLFCQRGQAAIKPPRQRAEPENRAMQKRNELHKSITTRDMGKFMCNHGVELRVVPLAPSEGE